MQIIISEPQASDAWDLILKKWLVCNCPNTSGPHYEFKIFVPGNDSSFHMIPLPPIK